MPDDVSAGSGPGDPFALTDDLLVRARAGDDVAFSALYVAVQPRLYRYAAVLVGPDADDVTAEAWRTIARDLRSFRGDLDEFRAWTARIVRNRAMGHAHYRARRPAHDAPAEILLDTVSGDGTGSEVLDRISPAEAITLIASLPPEQAEAIMLRAVIGLDARSAGKIVGTSAAAVRVSAHRGLRRLRTMLPPTLTSVAEVVLICSLLTRC